MEITRDAVLNALKQVLDPDLGQDIVTLGMVKKVEVGAGGQVDVTVELTTPACPLKHKIKADVEQAVRAVPGAGEVRIEMTARVRQSHAGHGHAHGDHAGHGHASDPAADRAPIPGVRNIIAVASGKGGVGKSTTAVNLAIALQRSGASVGLLDADIYGPNIPDMVGVKELPRVVDNRVIPHEAFGVRVMSMGFLIDVDQPVIFRGPMLHAAVRQLLNDVQWGELDYLVVDLPPGTGDVQLSLAQTVPLSGAVIVTTPQKVALSDVRKGIAMFRKLDVPILGIIENMAYYICSQCGRREDIFDTGGGRRVAELLDVPFLGEIPLVTSIREGMDEGRPIVVEDPDGPVSRAYIEAAEQVARQASIRNAK